MPKSHNNESKSKLWVDVPISPASRKGTPTTPASTAIKVPMEGTEKVRSTVTTLLRHHQVLQKQEREEKARVDGFMAGSSNFDYESWRHSKQVEDRREKEAQDAKRLLKSKLAYHKAIAATRQVQDEKQQAADTVRTQGRMLKDQLEEVHGLEMERRRTLAAEIKEEMWEPKRQNEELQLEKRRKAQDLKEETQRLRDEARQRDSQDLVTRKERIQQIQASKLAMKASTQTLSPNAFLGALGSPHADIKLKLTKEAEMKELEDKRKKVQEAKEQRLKKLAHLENKLTSHLTQAQAKRNLTSKFKDLPAFKHSVSEDKEINQLAKELEKLKSHNIMAGNTKNPSKNH